MTLKAIVMGAGKGTRMKSDKAKVLHEVAGVPMVGWAVAAAEGAGAEDIVVVVGHQSDQVAAALPDGVRTALQADQLGTGHAALVGFEALGVTDDDDVLVLPGDSPMLTVETLRGLVDLHRHREAAATLLTSTPTDPTGYGRVVRTATGDVARIVEHRDATDDERAIGEVNSSVYVFRAGDLGPALTTLDPGNDQGEYYLTDVVAAFVAADRPVAAHQTEAAETDGVNSHDQLAAASAEIRRRINGALMRSGVQMEDPDRTYIDATVTVEPGAVIRADVHLEGSTSVAAGAQVGPSVFARDCRIGEDALVWYAVLRQADVGPSAEVGPYVSLRPGAVLAEGAKAGTFVEIKNSVVGERSKVPHLSYIGDATIGVGANLGAGTITANYDGYAKHRTVIGDGARIGVDTMLVAPVEVGDEAWTGAGTVVTKDVPPGTLSVGRSPAREVPGYAARRKARSEQETD